MRLGAPPKWGVLGCLIVKTGVRPGLAPDKFPFPFLRPDAKSQVTMRYLDGKPHSINTQQALQLHSYLIKRDPRYKHEFSPIFRFLVGMQKVGLACVDAVSEIGEGVSNTVLEITSM